MNSFIVINYVTILISSWTFLNIPLCSLGFTHWTNKMVHKYKFTNFINHLCYHHHHVVDVMDLGLCVHEAYGALHGSLQKYAFLAFHFALAHWADWEQTWQYPIVQYTVPAPCKYLTSLLRDEECYHPGLICRLQWKAIHSVVTIMIKADYLVQMPTSVPMSSKECCAVVYNHVYIINTFRSHIIKGCMNYLWLHIHKTCFHMVPKHLRS